MEQSNKGDTSGWVRRYVLVNRLKVEYPKLTLESISVLTSRYLKNAVEEGYAEKWKEGNKAFYRVTLEGNLFLISRRDQVDGVMKWHEAMVCAGLMSFAVAPTGSPLIIENHDENVNLNGVELVDEFMRHMKEKNQGLRSLYLRFK